jgi:hypothetical protein
MADPSSSSAASKPGSGGATILGAAAAAADSEAFWDLSTMGLALTLTTLSGLATGLGVCGWMSDRPVDRPTRSINQPIYQLLAKESSPFPHSPRSSLRTNPGRRPAGGDAAARLQHTDARIQPGTERGIHAGCDVARDFARGPAGANDRQRHRMGLRGSGRHLPAQGTCVK